MDDISKVTNSILPTATELHSAVIKSLNEFDGNSYKKLKNNFKNYKGFTRILPSYIASIESVLEALTTNIDVDIDPSIINVVNNISESNAASPDITSSKPTGLSIVDSINHARTVVQGIQESVENLANIPLVSPIDIMKMHTNAYMIEFFLKDAFQAITKSLRNSNINYDEVNDLIGGTDTLEKIKIMHENKDSTKQTTNPDQLDNVIKEMKSKGKVSVTEALTDIINIIGQVLCMPLGFMKVFIFKRKIKKLTELLADSINTILNRLKGVNLIEFLNQMKLLSGADGSLPLLNKSLDIITEIVVKLKSLPKISMRKLTVILSSLANIQTIINKIAELNISDETNKKVFAITNMVDNLKTIFTGIILLGLLSIPVMIASVALMTSILFVSAAIWVISNVLPKEILLEQSLKKLIMIESIFWNLKSIYLSIAILGLLAIPLIVFFVPIMVSILLLSSVLILLQWCLKAIKPTNIIMGLILLNISIGLLIVTAVLLIALGLLGRQIIPNIFNILMTIGVIISSLLLFSVLGALVQFVLPFLLAFLGAVSLIALSFVSILVIAALIVAIANIKITEQIVENVKFNVSSIFDTIGVIGKLIWGNIRSMLSMTAAVPLLLGVVAALTPITLIAAQLLLISKINIPGNISEKLNELFNVIIGTGEENVGSLSIKGFIKSIDESLSKKEVRRVKKIVRNIKNIVRNIYKISQYLNDIQNVNPDKKKINESLNDIFEVILGGKFGKESEKEFSLVNCIADLESAIDDRRVLRRCNRILKNINNILSTLSDITSSLNSISEFKIDNDLISAGITNIFTCITTVENELSKMLNPQNAGEQAMLNNANEKLKQEKQSWRQKKKVAKQQKKYLSKVDAIIGEIGNIVESINSVKEFKIDTKEITTGVSNIFTCIETIITKLNAGSSTELSNKGEKLFESYSNIIQSLVMDNDSLSGTEKVLNKNIEFLDKIDKVDEKKLKSAANIFESLSKFSNSIKGDFNELADALTEKIAPLLEEMNTTLEKVNGSVKETSSNVATSVNLSNQKSLTQSQIEKQVSIENPNATQEQIRQEAQARHVRMERIQLEENSIMQEILNHLKNGKLQVVYS